MKRKRENCREESGKCPRANTLVFRCIGVGADNCHMLTVSVSDSDIIIIIIISGAENLGDIRRRP